MIKMRRGLLGWLVLVYATIFSAIVVLMAVLAFFFLRDVGVRTAQLNRAQLCEKIAAQVNDYLGEMQKMADQISSDSRLTGVFSALKADDDGGNFFERDILANLDVGSILTSHNGPSMRIWRICLYNAYGDFISAGAPIEPWSLVSETLASEDTQTLIELLERTLKATIILPPRRDRWSTAYSEQYVSMLVPLSNYYGSETYGVVELQQPVRAIRQRIDLEESGGIMAFLFDENGRQIIPSPEEQDISFLTRSGHEMTSLALERYGWILTLAQSRESILRPFTSVLWFIVLGGGLLMLALLTVVYAISRRVSAPLVEFSNRVRGATLSNLPENWIVEEGINEIHELSLAFSMMVGRLTQAAELEKKAYMQALQSQMNPHFLYNTLSIISALGIEAESDKIVYACEKLSGMLRYATDAGASTLEREVKNARDYLEIMRLRYEDYFSYEIVMEHDMPPVAIPKLILQPLVENCFEHAFKDVPPPWQVEISAKTSSAGWEISIADNGCGFDHGQLHDLEREVSYYSENLPENYAGMRAGGLGLFNTLIRLKLLGGVYCKITPNAPSGTVVTIRSAIGNKEGRSDD